jgi:protein-tyrosine-phosphatase
MKQTKPAQAMELRSLSPVVGRTVRRDMMMRNATALLLVGVGVLCGIGGVRAEGPEAAKVVFVCGHGTVKSVIASEWFNKLAVDQHLAIRAVARGVEPGEGVPTGIQENLRQDGFDLRSFKATQLTKADLSGAARVVAIGVDSPLFAGSPVAVEKWNDIPAAASGYAASRDLMRERVQKMLKDLSDQQAKK